TDSRRATTSGEEEKMKRLFAFVLLVGLGLSVWASFGSASDRAAKSTTVTISNAQGTTWTCGFNPFNGGTVPLSFGTVYEPLTFSSPLKSGATTNWLASSYAWSNHNRTLAFTIRSGVKWTDGKPFSAADVLFTFNMIKAHPALDLNGVWSVLKSVSQSGNK